MSSPLDNPIWQALASKHAHVALGDGLVRRYVPEVAPFVGLSDSTEETTDAMNRLVQPGEKVGILNVHPTSLEGWSVLRSLGIVQYVWEKPQGSVAPEAEAIKLGPEHLDRMLELTALVYPAYFRKGTAELGDYFGILQDGQLRAMAGIRFALPGFQEISAVCTHPDHRGNGYASLLSRHLIHHVEQQGDVPFLHTEDDNQAAQSVYERIGFTRRTLLPFMVIERV